MTSFGMFLWYIVTNKPKWLSNESHFYSAAKISLTANS